MVSLPFRKQIVCYRTQYRTKILCLQKMHSRRSEKVLKGMRVADEEGLRRSLREFASRIEFQKSVISHLSKELIEVLEERDAAEIEYDRMDKLLQRENLENRGAGASLLNEYAVQLEEKAKRMEVELAEMERMESGFCHIQEMLKISIEEMQMKLEMCKQSELDKYMHPAGGLFLHAANFKYPELRVSQTAPIESTKLLEKRGKRPETEPKRRLSPLRRSGENNLHVFFKSNFSTSRV